MTLPELRAHYGAVYRMITAERAMRERWLRNSPDLAQKLAECDAALAGAEAMKEELKRLLSPPAIQETLFDVPDKKIGGY